MSTCKMCKWWGEAVQDDYLEFFAGGRMCNKTFAKDSQNWALGLGQDRCGDPQSTGFVTAPDFGCIHYESK